MATTKAELEGKMAKIKAHMITLSTLIEGMDKDVGIHFEIGKSEEVDRESHGCYTSISITKTLEAYKNLGYSEIAGYFIDVWENGKPVADISMTKRLHLIPATLISPKVHFEINKRFISCSPEVKYDYETVFKSDSAFDCRSEWGKRGYSQPEYSFDIREAPKGQESYHVADIDISEFDVLSSVAKTPRPCSVKQWLVGLIKSHGAQSTSETLADKILEGFKEVMLDNS